MTSSRFAGRAFWLAAGFVLASLTTSSYASPAGDECRKTPAPGYVCVAVDGASGDVATAVDAARGMALAAADAARRETDGKVAGALDAARPAARDALNAPPERIWTSLNDGAGSGLEADALDGLDSADFLRVTGGRVSGDLSVGGSVTVDADVDVGGKVKEDGAALVPAGAVMAFNLEACPAGWAPLAAAQGRVIVGGGSVGLTRGSSLGDGAARTLSEVPSHRHVVRISGGNPHSVNAYTSSGYEPQAAGQGLFAEISSTSYRDPPGDLGILTGITGKSPAVDVTMPYLQLLYCQKT